jgi:hypothetical protein
VKDVSGEQLLPNSFAGLERFVRDWALDSEAQRNHKRLASSMADIQEFYDTMLRHMEAVLQHLSGFRLQELPSPERRLLHLALSLMEVAPAVEIYSSPDVPDAIEAHRFLIRGS